MAEIKISDIRIKDMGVTLEVKCPNCLYKNTYFALPSPKFECVRPCHKCEAILIFDCEEVK